MRLHSRSHSGFDKSQSAARESRRLVWSEKQKEKEKRELESPNHRPSNSRTLLELVQVFSSEFELNVER
jgi:hypothetical protein